MLAHHFFPYDYFTILNKKPRTILSDFLTFFTSNFNAIYIFLELLDFKDTFALLGGYQYYFRVL